VEGTFRTRKSERIRSLRGKKKKKVPQEKKKKRGAYSETSSGGLDYMKRRKNFDSKGKAGGLSRKGERGAHIVMKRPTKESLTGGRSKGGALPKKSLWRGGGVPHLPDLEQAEKTAIYGPGGRGKGKRKNSGGENSLQVKNGSWQWGTPNGRTATSSRRAPERNPFARSPQKSANKWGLKIRPELEGPPGGPVLLKRKNVGCITWGSHAPSRRKVKRKGNPFRTSGGDGEGHVGREKKKKEFHRRMETSLT